MWFKRDEIPWQKHCIHTPVTAPRDGVMVLGASQPKTGVAVEGSDQYTS